MIAILSVAFVTRLVLAWTMPNVFWPDEVFQTLEPAHRIVFGDGIVTWEYREGARNWILPGVLAAIMWIGSMVVPGVHGYLVATTLALCALSLTVVWVAFRWGQRTGGLLAAIIAAGLCAVWSDLLFFSSKALNEVVAAHLLLPGIYLGVFAREPRRLVWAAALCAGAAGLRVQLAPAVAIALVWLLASDWRARWRPVLLGSAGITIAFGLVDWLTWGAPFASYWRSFVFNVVEGRSTEFGWLPHHEYAVFLWNAWTAPIAIALGALAVLGIHRAPVLAVTGIVIVASHSFISHKEYRFIYPVVPMLLLLASFGAHRTVLWLAKSPRIGAAAALVLLSLGSTRAALAFDENKVYSGMATKRLAAARSDAESCWTRHGDALRAMRWIGHRDDVGGVGLLGLEWQTSGGYTHLHRSVPMFAFDDAGEADGARASFNYLIAKDALLDGYASVHSFGEIEVLRRDGPCRPAAADLRSAVRD